MKHWAAGENRHNKYREANDESATHKRRSEYRNSVEGTSRNTPTTLSVKGEDEIVQTMSSITHSRQTRRFGVQSLESAISAANEEERGKPTDAVEEPSTESITEVDSPVIASDELSTLQPVYRFLTMSRAMPLTTLSVRSPSTTPGTSSREPSTPRSGSPRSFRLSDEEESSIEDAASQAVTSSGEEEEDVETAENSQEAPSLVMPSIAMPSRRPFTEKGKSLGKLKVLVAGPKGKLFFYCYKFRVSR